MKINNNDVTRLLNDKDYICSTRHRHSLAQLKEKYPTVCPDHIIATALDITEEELEKRYQEIVACLSEKMGVQSHGK